MAQNSSGTQDQIEGYIARDGTYSVSCPTCFLTRRFSLQSLAPGTPALFPYGCACGRTWTVRMVGFRQGHRKWVRLAASVVPATDMRGTPSIATVENLSVSGMRLTTEKIRTLNKNDVLKVTCILDDPARTRLQFLAKVRRMLPSDSDAHMTIAVEYVRVSQDLKATLDHYLSS